MYEYVRKVNQQEHKAVISTAHSHNKSFAQSQCLQIRPVSALEIKCCGWNPDLYRVVCKRFPSVSWKAESLPQIQGGTRNGNRLPLWSIHPAPRGYVLMSLISHLETVNIVVISVTPLGQLANTAMKCMKEHLQTPCGLVQSCRSYMVGFVPSTWMAPPWTTFTSLSHSAVSWDQDFVLSVSCDLSENVQELYILLTLK